MMDIWLTRTLSGLVPADEAAKQAVKHRLNNYTIDSETGCWNWNGHLNVWGYGQLQVGSRTRGDRKTVRVHRVAFETYVRPLRDGELVLHRCDNPRCINHEHLFAGSHDENMRDMANKGRRKGIRARFGEDVPQSKLTEDAVREIRASGLPQKDIASKYGVSVSSVSMIKSGKTWKHLA